MTIFAGHYGSIELKRIGGPLSLSVEIRGQDMDITRKRFSLSTKDGQDIPYSTITTGDRIRLSTTDSRGLPFRFYLDSTNTTYIDNPGAAVGPLEFYANVDTMGAIRMYRTFNDAVNNVGTRYLAIPLTPGAGAAAWPVTVDMLPGAFNTLGEVTAFRFSTDRESIDVTSLGDRFRGVTASAISGNGSIDCLFEFKSLANTDVASALANLIQKVEVGSQFEAKLYLLEPDVDGPPGYSDTDGAFYQVQGMLTRSAMEAPANGIVECSFDFVTTGEFSFRTGVAPVDLATQAGVSIVEESTLDSIGLLQEAN